MNAHLLFGKSVVRIAGLVLHGAVVWLAMGLWVASAHASPVSYWNFDENSGTTAANSVGGGPNAILQNTTGWTTGRFNSGLNLNGTTNFVDVVQDISETQNTVSMWIKSTVGGGFFSVNAPIQGSYNDRNFFLSGGNVSGRVYAEETVTSSGTNFADGAWHHVVHQYGPGVGHRVYVDGVLRAAGTKSQSDAIAQTNLEIGWASVGGYFNGQIDDVAVWNDRLTSVQIQALAAGTATPLTLPASSMRDWVGGTADWSSATSWSGSAVPTSVDDASVTNGGTVQITALTGTANVASLNIGNSATAGSTVSLTGGTLNAQIVMVGTNGTLALGAGTLAPTALRMTGGTLQADTSFSSSQAVRLDLGGGIFDSNGNNPTFTGSVSGPGSLTKNGTGTFTLSGPNITYTGSTTVNGGTLTLSNTTACQSSTTINSLGILEMNVPSGTLTVPASYSISGNGTLLKSGSGTWVMGASGIQVSMTMAAGGLVDIEGGTIQNNFVRDNWTTNLASMKVASDAVFDMYSENVQIDALTGSGTVRNGYAPNGVKTLTVGAAGGSGLFSGTLSSTGGNIALVKIGGGTQTLSGANITYGGNTTVTGGTLKLDGVNSFGSNINNSATVELYSGSGGNWSLGSDRTISGNGTYLKTGPGRVALPNIVVTASGQIQVQQGTLSNESNSCNWSGSNVSLNVGPGAIFDIRADSVKVNVLTGSGSIANTFGGGGTDILTVSSGSFSGTISGSSDGALQEGHGRTGLTKVSTGTLTLSGANTYGGGTTIAGGTLRLGGSPVAGASVWLDAADPATVTTGTGNLVSQWNDKSGGGNHAAQTNGTLQPVYVASAVNGQPAVRFDGTNDYLVDAGYGNTGQTMSVFVVARRQAASGETSTITLLAAGPPTHDYDNVGSAVAFYEAGGTILQSYRNGPMSTWTHPGDNVPYVAATVFDGSNNVMYLNGAAAAAVASSGSFNVDNTYIGSRWVSGGPRSYYNGDIGEVLIYNSALNAPDRAAVEAYLARKWGLTLANPVAVNANNLPDGGAVSIEGGTLDIGNFNETVGAVTLKNGSIVGDLGTLTGSSYVVENGTISARLGGSAALTKNTAGTVVMSGNSTYTGPTTVSQGQMVLQNTTAFQSSTTIASGATLEFNLQGNNWTIPTSSLTFSGTGTLVKSGSGTMTLGWGFVNYVNMSMGAGGLIDIQGGTIRNDYNYVVWTNNNASLNVGALGTFDIRAQDVRIDALTGLGSVVDTYGTGGPNTLTIGVAGGSGTFSGTIAGSGSGSGEGQGILALTKTGVGTQTLSGANTYSGGTTVTAGRLLVQNTAGSATGSGTVTVSGSGTLGGGNAAGTTGFISGLVQIDPSGTLAPGASTGILTLSGGLTFTGGALAEETTGNVAGSQYDQIRVTAGSVSLGDGVATLSIDDTGYTPGPNDLLWIINNTGTGSTTGYFAGLPEGSVFQLGGLNFAIHYGADFPTGLMTGGNDVLLNFVPEPSTLALLGLGLTGLLGYGWRRRRSWAARRSRTRASPAGACWRGFLTDETGRAADFLL